MAILGVKQRAINIVWTGEVCHVSPYQKSFTILFINTCPETSHQRELESSHVLWTSNVFQNDRNLCAHSKVLDTKEIYDFMQEFIQEYRHSAWDDNWFLVVSRMIKCWDHCPPASKLWAQIERGKTRKTNWGDYRRSLCWWWISGIVTKIPLLLQVRIGFNRRYFQGWHNIGIFILLHQSCELK